MDVQAYPFEYRNWGRPNESRVIVPPGYIVDTNFTYSQYYNFNALHNGIPSAVAKPNRNPVIVGDTVTFSWGDYFNGVKDTLTLPDDGFLDYMRVYLTPSCAVVPDVPSVVRNFSRKSMNANWDGIALRAFAPATWLQPNYISWRSMMDNFNPGWNQGFSDGVHNVLQATFKAPKLIIQPLTPIQLGTNGVTTYDFNIQNVSNLASANSSFIHIDSTVGGMRVLGVYALPANTLIPKTGDIYKIGSIPAVTTRSYRVQLQFSKCTYDSIKLVAGWNCQGYPAADLFVKLSMPRIWRTVLS
jgi:hypothetical protein